MCNLVRVAFLSFLNFKYIINRNHYVFHRLDLFLQQNIVMNLFDDDYMLLSSTDGIIRSKSDTNLKEYQSFADLRFSKNKVISAIEWHPTIKGKHHKQYRCVYVYCMYLKALLVVASYTVVVKKNT